MNILKVGQNAVATIVSGFQHMENRLKAAHQINFNIFKGFQHTENRLKFVNPIFVEHRNKDGLLLGIYEFFNDVTTEGKNNLLDVHFHAGTQLTTWYIGLVDNSGFTAFAAADTLASHSGWNEFTNYTGNRQEWTEDAPAGGSITNSTSVDFPITGSGTLQGIFVASVATGTAGILWATASFSSTVPVTNGDTLKITYTVSL